MKSKGKLTDKEINEIANRYKEGQSLTKISRELSRTEDTVKKYLINLGIFRPRKISKTTDAEDDQSFILKYLMSSRVFKNILFLNASCNS